MWQGYVAYYHENECRHSVIINHLSLQPFQLNAVQVKVLLRVCPATILRGHGDGENIKSPSTHSPSRDSILRVEENRKQLTIFNSGSGLPKVKERVGVSAPKVYTFDSIFPADSSQVRPTLFAHTRKKQPSRMKARGRILGYNMLRFRSKGQILNPHPTISQVGQFNRN